MASKAWIYTAVYVASVFAVSVYYQRHEVKAVRTAGDLAVERTTNTLVSKYNKQLEAADTKFKKQSADMQLAADTQKATKDEAIAKLNVSLNSAISELRNRPSRPNSVASSPTQTTIDPVRGASCTAAQLYYEDAEFLTREAARAESVLLERNYYYSRYQTVKDQQNRANQ